MKQLLKQSLIFILFMVLGFQGGYAQKDGTITIKQTNVTLKGIDSSGNATLTKRKKY